MSKLLNEELIKIDLNNIEENSKSLAQLARVKFLIYSPIMYSIGAIVSCLCDGKNFEIKEYLYGISIVYGIHSLTHFVNEYTDIDTDRINETNSSFTGGSRILVKGLLTIKTCVLAAIIETIIVSLIILWGFYYLNYHVYSIYVGFIGIILSVEYSLPPIKASRVCLGELFTTIVLNFLCPLFGYFIQQQNNNTLSPFPSSVFWECLIPIGIVEFVRMMVMNMNDIIPDKEVNKITLPVYLGLDKSIIVHNIGMVISYLSLIIIYYFMNIPTSVLIMLLSTAPFAYHYSCLLHEKPLHAMIPFYASQHNGACMLAVYFGLIINGIFINPNNNFNYIEFLFTKQYGICLLFPIIIIIPSLPIMFKNMYINQFK
jgi:1,4-dihydroxy-2-naphthoate octaprenyltransferase